MILYSNNHVDIYHNDNKPETSNPSIFCCDLNNNHVPDYMFISEHDITPFNPQTLSRVSSPLVFNYKIKMKDFLFVFSDKNIAIKYFDVFRGDLTKNIKELLPELFL